MASGLVESSVFALAGTAMTVALVHTLVGVDHYLPFIALSRAQNWSLKKTWFWTALCGLGHVLSSIVLAALASLAGWAATRLGAIDGFRGDMAAYFLIAFGIGYAIWGVWRLRKGQLVPRKHDFERKSC
jgi:nickel/cobalt exporter